MQITSLSQAVETFFVRYRDKLVWVHAAMFLVFLAVIGVPLFLPEPPETATPLTHYTTFANYLLWGVWFPLVFVSVTRDKLARDGVRNQSQAIQTHEQVGKEVRDAIKRIGGTLPENIPACADFCREWPAIFGL
jgi:hypothetical protein